MFSSDRETSGTFTLWQSNIAHEASYTRITRLDQDLARTLERYAETIDDFAVIIMGDHGLGYGKSKTFLKSLSASLSDRTADESDQEAYLTNVAV